MPTLALPEGLSGWSLSKVMPSMEISEAPMTRVLKTPAAASRRMQGWAALAACPELAEGVAGAARSVIPSTARAIGAARLYVARRWKENDRRRGNARQSGGEIVAGLQRDRRRALAVTVTCVVAGFCPARVTVATKLPGVSYTWAAL